MKLIILGIDGLNQGIIEAYRDEMPCLYNHLKKDTEGFLRTTIPYYTAPTWTSFQTGKKIANHGIINFFKYDKELNLRTISGNDIKEKTFYEIMDKAGLKCFVMNLPYNDPPKIKGDLVFSWIHAQNKIEDLVYPSSLIEEYSSLKQYINYPDRSKSVIRYLESSYEVLLSQEAVIKEVITRKKHQVYFFLIAAADMAQHKAYDELMTHSETKKTKIARKILRKIDGLVQWIDEHKDEDTVILIASDHGFQKYSGKFFVNSWLKNHGYLAISKKGKEVKDTINLDRRKKKHINISKIVVFVKKHPWLFMLAERFYDFFIRYLPFDVVKQPKIDFERTKAFCRSTFEGIIFIRQNITGNDRKKLKKEIIEGLNELNTIEAYDCDEFLAGKYRDEMGDIIVTSKKYEIDNTIGKREFINVARNSHSLDGIFVAYGNGIKKNYHVKNANIYDVVPTALHMLGLKVPADMDGKVLSDIFSVDSVHSKRKVELHHPDKTEEEKDLLSASIKRLRL